MSTAAVLAPRPPRRRALLARAGLVLAATLVAHAWVIERARQAVDVDLPAPVAVVQAELFKLPAPVAIGAQPMPPVRRQRPQAITPPPPAATATATEPEPVPLPVPEPAPPAPETVAPEPPAPPVAPASPLDAVMVSFPPIGRFVSDTSYMKGLLRVFGTTTIEWRIGAQAYKAQSVTTDDVGRVLITIDSEGLVRPAVGVAPVRYVETRLGRSPQAANFQWDGDPAKVTFSASAREFELVDGAQDRLSFLAQLALLAQAFPDRFAAGAPVALQVAGTRDLRTYEFRVGGWEAIRTGIGVVDALKLERVLLPEQRDVRIELWLVPSLRWLPARTRTTLPNDEVIETVLKEVAFE